MGAALASILCVICETVGEQESPLVEPVTVVGWQEKFWVNSDSVEAIVAVAAPLVTVETTRTEIILEDSLVVSIVDTGVDAGKLVSSTTSIV